MTNRDRVETSIKAVLDNEGYADLPILRFKIADRLAAWVATPEREKTEGGESHDKTE